MIDYGYGYKPKVSSGKYLTLAKQGDSITIRLTCPPLHKTIHWTADDQGKPMMADCEGEDCSLCALAAEKQSRRMAAKEIFAWIVLDRNEENKPKIFKGGVSIYLAIKGLSENKAWGNPTGYDLEITRTEEKPLYYNVTPLPDKSPITKEEKEAIAKSGYSLEDELKGGKPTNTFGEEGEEEPEKGEMTDEEIASKDIPF